MKKLLLLNVLLLSFFASAQSLDAPVAEGVYGGRVNDIVAVSLGADSTRLVISTESANTLFYADLGVTNTAGKLELGIFKAVAGADFDDGFGSSVQNMAAHQASGMVYFVANGDLYKIDPSSGSASSISSMGVADVLIEGNNIYILKSNELEFGVLDASGNYMADGSSPISLSATFPGHNSQIVLDETRGDLLLFISGTTPELYVSSDVTGSFGSATTFNNISLAGMISSNTSYGAFNVAPDGYYHFMGNHYPTNSNTSDWAEVSRSMDKGLSWAAYAINFGGSAVGITGANIDFAGDSASYATYCGAWYNDSNFAPNHWNGFGHNGGVYRGYAANSGAVLTDPNNDSVVYLTTDVALGYSPNFGAQTKPLNKGITAVQVFDMDMTSDYSTGWVASKSGIRKVSNYKTSPHWSETDFPNGDGSGYSAADMANDDTNTVYVGNVRIYKTTNSGASWQLQFDPTSSSGGSIFPPSGTQCQAIEVNPFDTSIAMAGFANHHVGDGGLFYTLDGGSNWSQILIDASSVGSDVDVYDVIFTDTNTAYVGVVYDLAAPTGRSIYKVENILSGSPTVTQDMNSSGTATGTSITASIYDLELSPSGDTLFASGTDAGTNHPICYMKDLSGTALWEVISTSGFPTGTNQIGSAVTIGDGFVFCAVANEIYTYDISAASGWSLGYSYPVGTAINFLFYDELLVGTGMGLYAQDLNVNSGITERAIDTRQEFTLFPNPTSSMLNIGTIGLDRVERVKIFNLEGKLLLTTANTAINIENLEGGIYVVKIQGAQKSESHRVMIR